MDLNNTPSEEVDAKIKKVGKIFQEAATELLADEISLFTLAEVIDLTQNLPQRLAALATIKDSSIRRTKQDLALQERAKVEAEMLALQNRATSIDTELFDDDKNASAVRSLPQFKS